MEWKKPQAETAARPEAVAEAKRKQSENDAIRGSLIGGAAGDALGYVIEFSRENYIFSRYGKDGHYGIRFGSDNA